MCTHNGKYNYILIHLESVSSFLMNQNTENFPNIMHLIESSVYYKNYYSSATSTYMVITDLFFGEIYQFEKSNDIENIFSIDNGKMTLFDLLHQKYEYIVKQFCYGSDISECLRQKEVLCKDAFTWANDDLVTDCFIREFETSLATDKPFAFFIEDIESHITRIGQYREIQDLLPKDGLIYRYKRLDRTIGLIMDAMKRQGKYDNTVLVLYGDHGDDLWGHGLHDGYTHAIEPYAHMIHCPLIVHLPGENGRIDERLLSTVNILDLSLASLGLRKDDIFNKYVFSRNLFSGQGLCKESFNKSYSVTDGEYLLMVSGNGLKMYYSRLDPCNMKNILDFFSLKKGVIEYNIENDCLISGHYKAFMTSTQKRIIIHKFTELVDVLKGHVMTIYGDCFGGMNFKEIDVSREQTTLKLKLWMRLIYVNIIARLPRGLKDVMKKTIGR